MGALPKPTKFQPQLAKGGKLTVPQSALRFDFAAVKFADDKPDRQKNIPVSILARSGNALQHWWFGKCIHDMEGMTAASEQLPFDFCHRDDEVLGFSDKQDTGDDGLVMHGVLIPFKDKDRVDEVVTKHEAGFKWQASIYFDSDTLVLEFVPAETSVEVNGQEFEGPGVVFRQWMLRGAAICPYGYDPSTAVALSNKPGDEVAVSLLEKKAMATKPKKTALNKPAPNRHARRAATALAKGGKPKTAAPVKPTALASGKPAKTATKLGADEEDEELEADEEMEGDDADTETDEESDCDCEGEEDCDCDDEAEGEEEELEADEEDAGEQTAGKKSALSAAQKEARRYVAAFGDIGGRWYAQGLSFEKAQVKFNKRVRKENAALQNKVTEQATQLAALRGEEEPLSGGEGKPAAQKPMNGLSSNQSRFAATLTMPTATAARK